MGGFVKMDGRKDYRVEMDSVGAKDVPENVIAAGVPCKVIREITDKDKTDFLG